MLSCVLSVNTVYYYYKRDSRDCENVSDWLVVQYCPERLGRNVRYKPAAKQKQ